MSEPTSLQAGDSATWPVTLPAYPASAGWVLHYRLLSPTSAATFDAVAEGDSYRVTLSAATTAGFTAGACTLLRWVTKGAERITLGTTPLQVLADLTTAALLDSRTQNAKALADARAALAAHLAGGKAHVQAYTIAGRRMEFRSVADLQALINHYQVEVAKEQAAAALASGKGGMPPGRVITRM
jgi:hypothetical protein